MKRTSNNFVTRLCRYNEDHVDTLNKIRESVSFINKQANRRLFRVDVKPRKPIDTNKGYGYGGNVIGGLNNAVFVDVYIRPINGNLYFNGGYYETN